MIKRREFVVYMNHIYRLNDDYKKMVTMKSNINNKI